MNAAARPNALNKRNAAANAARVVLVAIIGAWLSACANGDFGRVKSTLVLDDIHAWVGAEAARGAGITPSAFPLTDKERLLRDLAYPMIEPPFDRQRFYSVLNEYGISRIFIPDWGFYDIAAYHARLASRWASSDDSAYNRLIDDIRNDAERYPQFADIARRVFEIDRKREKSFPHIAALSPGERHNALARISENALVAAWVQNSLAARLDSYRFALERLVIAQPSDRAAQVETALLLLRQTLAEHRLVVKPIPGMPAVRGPPILPPGA